MILLPVYSAMGELRAPGGLPISAGHRGPLVVELFLHLPAKLVITELCTIILPNSSPLPVSPAKPDNMASWDARSTEERVCVVERTRERIR
jgi:hypothetical protein